jgi:hypothetical protein
MAAARLHPGSRRAAPPAAPAGGARSAPRHLAPPHGALCAPARVVLALALAAGSLPQAASPPPRAAAAVGAPQRRGRPPPARIPGHACAAALAARPLARLAGARGAAARRREWGLHARASAACRGSVAPRLLPGPRPSSRPSSHATPHCSRAPLRRANGTRQLGTALGAVGRTGASVLTGRLRFVRKKGRGVSG